MSCYHPITCWRSSKGRDPETGKWPITFSRSDAVNDMPLVLPCGHCLGCKLDKSRSWAIRCLHEAQYHKENCFVTLTYRDECLPEGNSLEVRDFQLFMKRLRKEAGKVRYYHGGEYGEKYGRPHHHVCIFGWRPPDMRYWSFNGGIPLYRSALLEKLWPFGFVTVGDVTWNSAAYVARYVLKKQKEDSYIDRKPPYQTASLKPGIGYQWIMDHMNDVYPNDKVFYVSNNKVQSCKPPLYYDKILERTNEQMFARIKAKRMQDGFIGCSSDYIDSEICKDAQTKNLIRHLEEVL